MSLDRRTLLMGSALAVIFAGSARALEIKGRLPWHSDAGSPPSQVFPGPWQFFTPDEAAAVEAIVDRLIPPDPATPGGKDTGCAVFIDRQLAGPYGRSQGLYMRPPFMDGTPQQGKQSPLTPSERYRQSLAALNGYCRASYAGKPFAALTDIEKDKVLSQLEKGPIKFDGPSATAFFELILQNTREGFFADPIYGGNRDMAGWKMIGFPGARYDYRDWIHRHNERYPLPPVSIAGHMAGRS